jgi:hypothetical protein
MVSKAESNLEISNGFFRITVEDAVYNITVLESPNSAGSVA